MAPSPTRVVIVGGGFGGCFTARRLERIFGGGGAVEVSLVNRDNYFVFQPLLPEVASGAIIPHQIVNPIRRMLPRTRFFQSEVDGIDLEKREVAVLVGEGRQHHRLPFDHLVLAMGTVVNMSGMPGMSQHSLPMKNLGDAFYLRNHVVGCLENADIEPDPELKRALLTFVVVGGGFSGVETIGELQETIEAVLPSYPNIRRGDVKLLVIQSGPRILPEVVPGLADYARKVLEARGVEVITGTRCQAATADAVLLPDGRRVPTRTLVSTVGNAPHPLLSRLPVKREKGRVVAEETLSVPGWAGVWALGDCAHVVSADSGQPYAPTAQNAIRQATVCADNIAAAIRGRPLRPFRFRALGSLASIGRRSAVAQIMGMRFSGFVAWFLWRTIYLSKLPGWERRLRVALDWTLDLFFKRDLSQLKVFQSERVDEAHYEPGESIVKQGEIGDRFYIIARGAVEVVREDEGGLTCTRLARLGPGEHFGEVALLQNVPRTATVRAVEPTDVVCIGRGDFDAVARSFSLLKAGLQQEAIRRGPS
ncbi:MAG TPA: FAD-dependent oxidoreductase [Myxococcales bacterium]|jgi:NADH dehydrogenase|nr:FAD-dependent oxidoreductase [Myxococcales bacterium]